MKKEQLNARVPSQLKRAVRVTAAALNWSTEKLIEVALESALGSKDKEIARKQKELEETAHQLNLSFDSDDSAHIVLVAA